MKITYCPTHKLNHALHPTSPPFIKRFIPHQQSMPSVCSLLVTHNYYTFYFTCWAKHSGKLYEGYSKSSKTNSKKYFIYEIYKIIFLHSFHPIHNTSVSDGNIVLDGNTAYRSVMNWIETM